MFHAIHTAHSCSHEVSQAKRADKVFSVSGVLALLKLSDSTTPPAYFEHNIPLDFGYRYREGLVVAIAIFSTTGPLGLQSQIRNCMTRKD